MNNTNQQLYTIYKNIQSFYAYRKLVSLDDELSQDQFIKAISKDKYIILSAVGRALVIDDGGNVDKVKLKSTKTTIESYNEKNGSKNIVLTNILLVYPGTECESKRANMMKLINHIRFPSVNVIIITPSKISAGVAKGLQLLSTQKEHREHTFKAFTYTLLNSVIPEYDLAPRYEILTSEQIDELKAWFLDPATFPKVFENDPQMVWIGAKVGDVVKYTFLSETTIEGIGYCTVIPNV